MAPPPSPLILWFGVAPQTLIVIGIDVFHRMATH